jgi:hypothetical protein
MEINGKVHCFFEQSGTFKNEFIKLGIPAEDYDIQDNFGQTDHVVDLFSEIEKAYGGGQSVFDNITKDDLIVAFFPCIYFCAMSQMAFTLGYTNYRKMEESEKIKAILEREENRTKFYRLMLKLVGVCLKKGFRMVMENPWSEQTYLKANSPKAPDVVDMDRTKRGDCMVKPTAYWFWNCEATNGFTYQPYLGKPRTILETKGSAKAGLCSEERSMISPDYARNFICDFILGKKQNIGQLSLF